MSIWSAGRDLQDDYNSLHERHWEPQHGSIRCEEEGQISERFKIKVITPANYQYETREKEFGMTSKFQSQTLIILEKEQFTWYMINSVLKLVLIFRTFFYRSEINPKPFGGSKAA